MKKPHAWVDGLRANVIVADTKGRILEMNPRACEAYAKDGGAALIGKSLLDCHPAHARAKVEALLASGATNAYTITKDGRKKLVYQAPWFEDGERAGIVELSLEIPNEMPHFDRDAEAARRGR